MKITGKESKRDTIKTSSQMYASRYLYQKVDSKVTCIVGGCTSIIAAGMAILFYCAEMIALAKKLFGDDFDTSAPFRYIQAVASDNLWKVIYCMLISFGIAAVVGSLTILGLSPLLYPLAEDYILMNTKEGELYRIVESHENALGYDISLTEKKINAKKLAMQQAKV